MTMTPITVLYVHSGAATIHAEWSCGCRLTWPVVNIAGKCVPQTPSVGEQVPLVVAEACRVFNLQPKAQTEPVVAEVAIAALMAATSGDPLLSTAPHDLVDGRRHFFMTVSGFNQLSTQTQTTQTQTQTQTTQTIRIYGHHIWAEVLVGRNHVLEHPVQIDESAVVIRIGDGSHPLRIVLERSFRFGGSNAWMIGFATAPSPLPDGWAIRIQTHKDALTPIVEVDCPVDTPWVIEEEKVSEPERYRHVLAQHPPAPPPPPPAPSAFDLWKAKLVSDPDILGGLLLFPGTRHSVHAMAALSEQDVPLQVILTEYPQLSSDDLAFAVKLARAT